MAEWLLYEHDDGRHAVAPSAEAATFAHGDPKWHRVGPVEAGVPASQPAALTDAQILAIAREQGDEAQHGFIFNKDGRWSVLAFARALLAAADGVGASLNDQPKES